MDDEFVEVNTTRGKLLISQSLLPSTPEELERIYPQRGRALDDRHDRSIQSTQGFRRLAEYRDTSPWPPAASCRIPTQSQTNGSFPQTVSSPHRELAPATDWTHTDKPAAKPTRSVVSLKHPLGGFTPKPAVTEGQCAALPATSVAPLQSSMLTTGNLIEDGAHSVASLALCEPQCPPPVQPVGGLGDARTASAMTSLAALDGRLRNQNRERLSVVNDKTGPS
ncbi:hypothetical protein PCL_12079 [Purpureocillium lilacinum]|uniref:Uncharacterized protein n=1 Tax=Purpureocillium lilacinum TaxID=33203 RepID=A0A2U3DPI7_PURLI|nr:hypothetical protein PCL_12079 [Purpureocillium lilacinum]